MKRMLLWTAVCWIWAGATAVADELDDARARVIQNRLGELKVRFVDETGKPLAGVEVNVKPLRPTVRFGCNLFMWDKCATPEQQEAYRARFAEVFDYATLPFYWNEFEPQQGRPQNDRLTAMARWCHEQNITPKGHPLVWNNADPPWLPADSKAILSYMLERVGACVRYYGPLSLATPETNRTIDIWDVVNEGSDFERQADKAPKLTTMWREVGQTNLPRETFRRARQSAQEVQLLINDYVTDERYEKLIESLRQGDGTFPFHAIGIQSHMHQEIWPSAKIRDVCERFAKFGLPLHFTEVTILSGEPGWEKAQPWPSTPEGEARQAREVERVYCELVAQPAVAAITWWDLSDQGSWQGAPAGLLRADMSPKPAYDVLKRLITKDWASAIRGKSDEDGRFVQRMLAGDRWVAYTIGSVKGGRSVTVNTKQHEPVVITIRTGK